MNRGTEAFWLLTEPFDPEPDERFLIPTPPVRSAIAGLREALTRRPGWIALVGWTGTGKSVLARLLVESLRDHAPVAYVADSGVAVEELRSEIETQLGDDDAPATTTSLAAAHRAGRRALVILDGAEPLSDETADALEAAFSVRDEDATTRLLVDLVVILDASPDAPLPDWLQRRGAKRFVLGSLSADETAEYVRRRIRLAAGGERDLFDAGALDEVHRRTQGRPDAVNRLCGLALDRVANAGGSQVGSADIREAAALLGDLVGEVQLALSIPDADADARPLNGTHRPSSSPVGAMRTATATPRPRSTDAATEPDVHREIAASPGARAEAPPARDASAPWRIVLAAVAGAIVGALLTLWLAPAWNPPDATVPPASWPAVASVVPTETAEPIRAPTGEAGDRVPGDVDAAQGAVGASDDVAVASDGAEAVAVEVAEVDEPASPAPLATPAASEAAVIEIGSLPAVSTPPPAARTTASLPAPTAAERNAPEDGLPADAPAPPPRIPLPLDQAAPILSRAFLQRAEPGTAWTLRLMDTHAGRPQPIERVQMAHGEFDGRIRTLAAIEGDGDRRAARLLDEGRDRDGSSARVYWPEDRVMRSVAADDPFAGTGFRYSDFRPHRAGDFSLVSLFGDQRDGEPVFTVTAERPGANGPERTEFVIGERDGRLLEIREFASDRATPVRRLLMPRPTRAALDEGGRVEEWRLLGPNGREIARAHLEIARLAEDAGPELFTFSRLSDPNFRVPTR